MFTIGQQHSEALAVSGGGNVVGGWSHYYDNYSGVYVKRAFRWTPEDGMHSLPGGAHVVLDIAGYGDTMVGWSGHKNELMTWGTHWDADFNSISSSPFNIPWDKDMSTGVTRGGTIMVGTVWDREDNRRKSYVTDLWHDVLTFIGDLPDGGGTYETEWTRAYDISADGSVVVGGSESSRAYEPIRWTESGGLETLGNIQIDRYDGWATAVSGDGQRIVGRSANLPFIWTTETGMHDLTAVLVSFGISEIADWEIEEVSGISEDGRTLVGTGINPAGMDEAWVIRLGDDFDSL